MNRALIAVVMMYSFCSAVLAMDYEREKRWSDQILPAILIGEPVWLKQKNGHEFLALYTEAEKPNGLEPFYPERLAARILGMGDVLALVEEARKNVDAGEAEKLARKVQSGKGFDLEDFKSQMQQMKKMGGLSALIDKLPAQLAQAAQGAPMDDRVIGRTVGIIESMTPQERAKPEIIKASRKRRIAAGAGVSIQEVNRLLGQFEQVQKMMKMMGRGGLQKMMRGMKGGFPGMR